MPRTNSSTSDQPCSSKEIPAYSHSIVAVSKYMVSCLFSCRLVRLLSRNPNHFVITGVIANPPNSANIAVFHNDSLAITPRNTNGDNGRWFAMVIIHRLTSSQRLFRELCRNRFYPMSLKRISVAVSILQFSSASQNALELSYVFIALVPIGAAKELGPLA